MALSSRPAAILTYLYPILDKIKSGVYVDHSYAAHIYFLCLYPHGFTQYFAGIVSITTSLGIT